MLSWVAVVWGLMGPLHGTWHISYSPPVLSD